MNFCIAIIPAIRNEYCVMQFLLLDPKMDSRGKVFKYWTKANPCTYIAVLKQLHLG